ncbi:MAG: T4SS-associated protein EirA [Gammaproteobacteria bacterium]|nr:T4SS-associated protein EirA [Gammaproteobacteria bacterium]
MRYLSLLILSTVTFGTAIASTQSISLLCPHPAQAKKSTDPTKSNWIAETKQGKWKSYDSSFATKLTQFVGAQWTGENIGQITCIYDSEQDFTLQGQAVSQKTLPVLLVFHILAFQPAGGKWKHIGHGVYNCYSLKRSDCSFKINMRPKAGNIMQEAESLKSTAHQPQQLPTH